MKRLLYLTALSMVVMAMLAPAALAQQDVDCPQLSQGKAQAILNADPSDPNRLDADDDGLACEDGGGGSTQQPASANTQQTTAAREDDVDCDDFVSAVGNPSQFQAQQFFGAHNPAQDPFNLDADDDGIACEGLETGVPEDEATAPQQYAATAQYNQYAAPGTAAPAAPVPNTVLPDTGGLSLPLVAGALLLGSGVLGLSLLKRAS